MPSSLSSKLWDLASRFLDEADEELPSTVAYSEDDLADKVRLAKDEWTAAQIYFNQAIEPELVDHAILSLQAAERKYMYWLKQMKDLE